MLTRFYLAVQFKGSIISITINFNITQNDTTICFGDSVVLSVGNTNIYSACALPTNLENGLVAYFDFEEELESIKTIFQLNHNDY